MEVKADFFFKSRSLANSSGAELHLWRHNPSFPRFKDQSHTESVRTQPGRTHFTTNVCGRKSSSELFPLATTHAKVANSGKSEVW